MVQGQWYLKASSSEVSRLGRKTDGLRASTRGSAEFCWFPSIYFHFSSVCPFQLIAVEFPCLNLVEFNWVLPLDFCWAWRLSIPCNHVLSIFGISWRFSKHGQVRRTHLCKTDEGVLGMGGGGWSKPSSDASAVRSFTLCHWQHLESSGIITGTILPVFLMH
jgi:hypothetical protein